MPGSQSTYSESRLRILARTQVEPYRYLFAIGAINAISGAFVWVLYALGWMTYPANIHPLMMSGGFLLTMAYGFLWTALPRFTQSKSPTFGELSPLLATSIAATLSAACNIELLCTFFLLCGAAITLRFAVGRFRQRRQNPPESFVFVGVALLLGTLSLGVMFVHSFVALPDVVLRASRSFFLKGVMLFLTLGVGFRLIPAILGVNAPQRMEPVDEESMLRLLRQSGVSEQLQSVVLILVLLTAFVLEALGYVRPSALFFAVALGWSAFRGFHIHRVPALSNRFAFIVWCSVICMLSAPVLILIFPTMAIHMWHMLFIGGLGLVTAMVSTRVSISHSGFASVHVEERRQFVAWIGGLVLLAAFTRASVAWWPEMATTHYAYAACAWIVAMLIWGKYFLKYSVAAERAHFNAHPIIMSAKT